MTDFDGQDMNIFEMINFHESNTISVNFNLAVFMKVSFNKLIFLYLKARHCKYYTLNMIMYIKLH